MPVSGELLDSGQPNLIDQIDQIIERDGGIIEAYVPIELINQEEVAVDQSHVEELAESIKQESERHETTGQLTPVLLGQLDGEETFRIIDGFHRVPAVKLVGKEMVYATVKTNCSMEDVIDLRIVAAKSHKKVKFSRVVEWVEEAWQETEWADNGIEVSSAFVMTFLKGSGTGRGKGNGLQAEDVEQVRDWVRRKCQQWDISPVYVDRYLRTARAADPELVKTARERTSGHKLDAVTPMHLTQIVRHLPNDYPLQNVVADAAVVHALTVSQAQALSLAISKADSYEAIDRCVDSRIWERMASASKSLAKKRYEQIDPKSPESYVTTLVDKFFDDQLAIVEVLVENAILKGTYRPEEETAGNRVNDLLIMSDVVPEEVQELPEDQRLMWSEDRIQAAAEKVIRMQPFLSSVVRRQFPFNEHDSEDIVSEATIRFINRVNDGRLPEQYEDESRLRRLMANFVTYAAIDEIRRTRGRQGQKPTIVSMHAENDDGLSLEKVLKDPDSSPDEEIEIPAEDRDFMKNLLPFLNERERRVAIMKAQFELTSAEIANILGTTEGTISQTFRQVKLKAIKLSEEAQAEIINLAS